jgi:hypothetical protein
MDAAPGQVSDVVNIATTVAGDAKDGAYVINTPRDSNCLRFKKVSTKGVMIEFPGNVELVQGSNSVAQNWGGNDSGFCHAGVFLTGLAQSSSFRVRYRTYWEFLPGVGSTSLAMQRIARPGPLHSAVVEEALRIMLRTMPAGCRYIDNPLGEWFDSLLGIVEEFAPTIGSALGAVIPGAGLIGQGLSSLAGAAKKKRQPAKAIQGGAASSTSGKSLAPSGESDYSRSQRENAVLKKQLADLRARTGPPPVTAPKPTPKRK